MISVKHKKTTKDDVSTYTYAQAFAKCLIYFGGDELAANTWLSKYAMKNKKGEFLESTPGRHAFTHGQRIRTYRKPVQRKGTFKRCFQTPFLLRPKPEEIY